MDRESRLPEKLLEFLYSECAISGEQIANLLDSSPTAVFIMLKKYGIKRRKPHGIHIDKIHAAEILLEARWSTQSIQRATGLGVTFIRKIRQENEDG